MGQYPCVLAIAGSDPSGGAGMQADIKTMTMLGTYVTNAFTVLTALNSVRMGTVYALPVEFIQEQIAILLEDFPIKAIKTGMLFSREIIETVSESIAGCRGVYKVIDPVCVCVTQGSTPLLREDGLKALKESLFPQADLITPNKAEAELLSGKKIRSDADIVDSMESLLELGVKAVFLKGENVKGATTMCDWFMTQDMHEPMMLEHKRVDTIHTHGTGCTTAAAITAFLAKGDTLLDAVLKAQEYIVSCLEDSVALGKGIGSPNHMAVKKYL